MTAEPCQDDDLMGRLLASFGLPDPLALACAESHPADPVRLCRRLDGHPHARGAFRAVVLRS